PTRDPDLACLVPQASVGATLQGGLRLGDRSWLFQGGEPTVFVRNAIADRALQLLVDGRVVATLPPEGGSFSLRDLDLEPGDHEVGVAGRTLRFATREGSDPPSPPRPCRPLTIPLVRHGKDYDPTTTERFDDADIGPAGVIRVRGAEVIGRPS